jgi:hypothetical protein
LQEKTEMKTKFIIALIIFLSVFYSCKEESKQKESDAEKTAETVNNAFTVTLDIVAKKDDNLHLYYTEDNSIDFTEEQSVWAEIKGNEAAQKVVFKLSEDALPTDLRFDIGYGKNIEQKEIIVNNINFEYFGKSFNIKGNEIANYFYPNKESTILDATTGILSRVKVDQETAPSLYPHTTLKEELLKIVRQ